MSGSENGNGFFRPIEIDVTNDYEFKTGVVKHLQLIVDNTREIPVIKKKVEKHDKILYAGKWLIIPVLWVIHALLPENHLIKSFLTKLVGG
jgi:hypothetical protein